MLLVSISLILSSCTVLGYGILTWYFLAPRAKVCTLHLGDVGMLGILTLLLVTQITNFLLPLNEITNSVIFITGLLVFIIRVGELRSFFSNRPRLLGRVVVFTGLLLIFLVKTSQLHWDTGLYHQQTIRWIHEFPITFGLVNLRGPLGFNSAWYKFAALFWLPGLGLAGVYTVNGLIMMMVLITLLQECVPILVSDEFSGQAMENRVASTFAIAVLGLIPTFKLLMIKGLGSPNADVPATLMTWYAFFVLLRMICNKEKNALARLLPLVVAGAVTIKLSTAPVALLGLYPFLAIRKRKFGKAEGFALALILVWILSGVVTSGCLMYPAPGTCIHNLPWVVDEQAAAGMLSGIRAYARYPGFSADQVLSNWAWIPHWLNKAFHNVFFIVLVTIWIIGAVFLCMVTLRFGLRNRKSKFDKETMIILLSALFAAFAGVLFWFMQAPDLRFGIVFLVPCALLPGLAALYMFNKCTVSKNILLRVVTIVSALWAIRLLAAVLLPWGLLDVWPKLPTSSVIERTTVDGTRIAVPDSQSGYQCWDQALPCTENFNPELRYGHYGYYPVWRIR
jgi:hypothetical protein